MKSVYGVSNTSHIDLFRYISKQRPKDKIFLQGRDLPDLIKTSNIAIFNSVDFLNRYKDFVNKNCIIFITDLAVNLNRVAGIVLIDTRLRSNMETDFYTLSDYDINECLNSDVEYPYKSIKIKDINLYDKLFKKQPTSVLSNIFTSLYSIQNKKRREEVKNQVLDWLLDPEKSVESIVQKVKLRKGNSLRDYLFTEDVAKLKTILAADQSELKELVKKYNVAKFDVKYLLKFKQKKTEKVTTKINLTQK